MKVTLALLADYANVSEEGKLNVLGIFDQITTAVLPALHPQAHLVLRFEASAPEQGKSKDLRIELIDADGRREMAIEGRFSVPTFEGRVLVTLSEIIRINNILFTKPGDYSFRVLINGEEREAVPFRVSVVPRAGAEAIEDEPGR